MHGRGRAMSARLNAILYSNGQLLTRQHGHLVLMLTVE